MRHSDSLVDLLNGLLADRRVLVREMVKHHHVRTLAKTIERDAANLVRFIATLEQLQREESPVLPREFAELREIVQAGVVKNERLGFELCTLVANLLTEVQHALLDRVDCQLATVDPNPAPAQLFSHHTGRTGTSEGIKDKITSPEKRP